MRWVLMLFVILAAVMGGEARAVVVMGRVVVRSDCGDRKAQYTVTAAAGSAWTAPSAAIVQHVRGPDLGGGSKGLLYSLRNGLPTFNRYNGRGDVVAQSDIDGTTTWAASYQADGRRTAEAGTNVERHWANCLPKATRVAASGLVFQAAFAAGRSKEEDPTGLLNEGFRYRDMETGTFISRLAAGYLAPLGWLDHVWCAVGSRSLASQSRALIVALIRSPNHCAAWLLVCRFLSHALPAGFRFRPACAPWVRVRQIDLARALI